MRYCDQFFGRLLAILAASIVWCMGSVVTHAAPPKASHFFPAGAQRGTTADVQVSGTYDWPLQAWVDRPNVAIVAGEEKGKLLATVSAEAEPGLVWVRLYDSQGATALLPFVIGNLPESLENEPNDAPAEAQLVSLAGTTVNGRLAKRDDVDVYAVALQQGQVLVASALANEALASPMDAVLQITDEAGIVLAQDHDHHGLDPQIEFSAPRVGRYLVRIFSFPSQPDSRIGLAGGDNYVYRLTLTTGPFVDYSWPLAVQGGTTADIRLVGWNIGDQVETQKVSVGANRAYFLDQRLAGRLQLPAVPYPSLVGADRSDTPQLLDLPLAVSRRLATPGEKDLYQVSLKKDETLLLELRSASLGFPVDGVLKLTNAEGKSLARVDDSDKASDPRLTFKAPADGEYRICVSNLVRQGSSRHVYLLTAAIAKPDFSISTPGDNFTTAAGKALEIAVAVDREHGFAGEVTISAEGLPASFTAAPVVSRATDETSKAVKLMITGPEPYVGPLTITAQAAESPGLRRVASAKSRSGSPTEYLWVTVQPAAGK